MRTLSGGMIRRVGIAQAMLNDPRILVLDEPTAGLDPQNTLNVVSIMQQLKARGLSSIFVTHDIPSALSLCDRILILHQGKIIFNDSPLQFQFSSDPEVKKFFIS